MSRALVLSVRRYSFTNDAGEVVEGCTVTFLDPLSAAEPGTDRVGMAPLTINGPQDLFSSFAAEGLPVPSASPGARAKGGQDAAQGLTAPVPALPPLPAVFDLGFAMRPGKNSRPVLSLVAAEYVESVDIAKLVKSAHQGK